MNPLERELSARLNGLADELTGGAGADAGGAVTRWRHRRRTRRTLTAVAAVVAAVAIGAPVAAGSLSTSPTPVDVARPVPIPSVPAPTTPSTAVPTDRPVTADAAEAVLTEGGAEAYGKEPIPEVSEAERLRLTADAEADLARVAAELPSSLVLTSPTEWDQWLPESKPYPGRDTEEDIATCPVLSEGLSSALGQRMSYWIGTLPSGPYGCQWAPVPLLYDTIDYPFLVSVGFLSDGTTPETYARSTLDWVPQRDPTPCPATAAAGAGMLVRCASGDQAVFQLAVPDARGAGTWVVIAMADRDGRVTAADAFTALLDGVVRAYG